MESRISNGVIEHKHGEYDYWHPAVRMHSESAGLNIGVSVDGNQIAYAATSQEVLMVFDTVSLDEIPDDLIEGLMDMDPEVIFEIGRILNVAIDVVMRNGIVRYYLIWSNLGNVMISRSQVSYILDSELHHARVVYETGMCNAYMDRHNMSEIIRIMDICDGKAYYDLIDIPGDVGHIPVPILMREFDISWEILAKFERGDDRNDGTFACPMCGRGSYYTGLCQECEFTEANAAEVVEINEKTLVRRAEKDRIIYEATKSGGWTGFKYMVG